VETNAGQRLLDVAPFTPDITDLLKHVFDEAWPSIAPTIAADLVSDTRLALAHAIIAFAAKGKRDSEALKAAALEAVRKRSPERRRE